MLRDGIQFRRREKNQSVIFGGIRRKIPDTYVKNGNARCRFFVNRRCGSFMVYRSATIVFAPARRGARAGERLSLYRSLAFVFAPARFLDCGFAFARNDEAKYRFASTSGRRGRPALPKRETTFQTSTCSRRYTCGRTRNAPTYSPESKYGHRRLARRGFPAIVDLPTAHRHCRLANGSPSLPTCHLGAPTDEKRHIILKPSPLGARRGGAKHRKNSPQVTVFSQSGEATMLRAGRWIAEAIAKARRMRGRAKTHEA